MKTGILLIAIGNPIYIRMAANLAISIRANDPTIAIALVHDDSIGYINELHKTLFNYLIPTQETNAFKLKLDINKLTVFDKTLYLDADMVNCKGFKVSDILSNFKQPFVIANRGIILHNDWETITEPKLNVSGEFIYFEKSAITTKIFNDARKHYDTPYNGRTIGGYRPEEPSIVYAIEKNKYTLEQMPYYPTFWDGNTKAYVSDRDIKQGYAFLSMGGNKLNTRIQQLYDSIMKHYSCIMYLDVYKHQNKNTTPLRKII
jgi:hypothetical protein